MSLGRPFTVLDRFWSRCYARRQIVREIRSQRKEMKGNARLRWISWISGTEVFRPVPALRAGLLPLKEEF